MDSSTWGSIGVIEEFFGASLGKNVTARDVRELPLEQFEVLRERLAAVTPEVDVGEAGARAWRTDRPLSARATLVTGHGSDDQVLATALYLPQIVLEDPVWQAKTARELSFYIESLTRLRPLVASGAVVLYPPAIGWGASSLSELGLVRRPQGVWSPDVRRWADELLEVLPQGQVGEVAEAITANMVAAAAFDVDTASIGRYAPMVQTSLTTAGLRTWQLCSVVLPRFSGLSPSDVAAVREDTGLFAEFHSAFNQVADSIPEDPDRALRQGPEIAREILTPVADGLRKRTRRSPTLADSATAVWTLAAAGVDLDTHALTAGSAMIAAAAPIALFANWLRNGRRSSSKRSGLRILRSFIDQA